MHERPTVGSLFSGVGGFDLGLERAGFRIAFQCEADPFRRRVLRHRFPDVPVYPDVRDMGTRGGRAADEGLGVGGGGVRTGASPGGRREPRDDGGDGDGQRPLRGGEPVPPGEGAGRTARDPADLPGVQPAAGRKEHAGDRRSADAGGGDGEQSPSSVSLLCGGFPCQDLSVAGRRAGLGGDRSGLFYEFMRLTDEFVRPGGYVLIENVPGLFSSNGGRDFAIVLASLAELGFHDLAWRVLDSRHFGVPQRRRRVYILGRRASGRVCAEVLLESESGEGNPAALSEAGPPAPAALGSGPDRVSRALAGKGGRLDQNQEDLVVPGADDSSERIRAGELTQSLTTRFGSTGPDLPDGEANWLVADGPDAVRGASSIRTANTGANGQGVRDGEVPTLDGTNGPAIVRHERVASTLDGGTGIEGDGGRLERLVTADDVRGEVREEREGWTVRDGERAEGAGGLDGEGRRGSAGVGVGQQPGAHPADGGRVPDDPQRGAGADASSAADVHEGAGGPPPRGRRVVEGGGGVEDAEHLRGRGVPGVDARGGTEAGGGEEADADGDGEAAGLPGRVDEPPLAGEEPHTFDWQAGGHGDDSWRGKSRQWIDDKPGTARSLSNTKVPGLYEPPEEAWAMRLGYSGGGVSEGETGPLDQNTGVPGIGAAPFAVHQPDTTHTLTSEGHDASEDGTGRGTPLVANTLKAQAGKGGSGIGPEHTFIAESPDHPDYPLAVALARDGYLPAVPIDALPDGPRYASMGDAVTVPVAFWIGSRLMRKLEQLHADTGGDQGGEGSKRT